MNIKQSKFSTVQEKTLMKIGGELTMNYNVKATYKYVADGTKASAIGDNGVGFEYLGSLVYNNNNGTKTLESTSFGGGRINKSNSDYEIDYFITDHLGSTRVIVDNAGNIKEQNDYYPFGLRHENSLLMVSSNRWGYNNKEKQTIFAGFNLLDYGNRMYDDFIARWLTQDPLQEVRPWLSSYNFCSNSPVNRVDPDGMIDWKAVYKGALNMIAGAAMMVGGTLAAPFSLGASGTLVVSGMGVFSFGTVKTVGGIVSDGSEQATKTLESLPTSLPDVGAIVIDQAMGNENNEARNVMKIIEGIIGVATGDPATAAGAFSTVMSTHQAIEGMTGLINSNDNSSQNSGNTNNNTNGNQTNSSNSSSKTDSSNSTKINSNETNNNNNSNNNEHERYKYFYQISE